MSSELETFFADLKNLNSTELLEFGKEAFKVFLGANFCGILGK